MGNRYLFLLRNTLLFIDFLIVNNSFLFTVAVFSPLPGSKGIYFVLYSCAIFNALWMLLAWLLKLYPKSNITGIELVYRATWKTTILHAGIISLLYIFMVPGSDDRKLSMILFCYSLMGIMSVLSRFFLTYIMEYFIKKTKIRRKIVVVGYNNKAKEIAEWLSTEGSFYSFEGFFDDHSHSNLAVSGSGAIIGSIDTCIGYAVKQGIKEVYSTILPEKHNKIGRLVKEAEDNCVSIRFVPSSMNDIKGDYYLLHEEPFPIIGIRSEPLADLKNRWKKRIFDLFFSSFVTLFVLSWLVPIIGLLIKLESRGPVFFVQKRSGRYNDVFRCIKFRTMTVSDKSDLVQATKGDNRITRIGAFLRKTSLDEFPQFLNVFMGDMSIIGPRPHMLAHTEQYRTLIDRYMVRQFVKPGISGWAQVNGYRGETETNELMEKRVEHDIWYMENWSLMLDIRIVFLTIINMIRGEERAY